MSLSWVRLARRTAGVVGLSLTGLAAVLGTAQADYIADGTLDHMYAGLNPYGAHWVDRVGSSEFELFGINVSSSAANGGTVNLSIFTNYGLKDHGSFATRTADISFKLTGETGFNHGLILTDHQGGAISTGALGSTGARGDTNTLSAGFYSVTDWSTSQEIFGAVSGIAYGGVAKVCTNDADCGDPSQASSVNTYLNQGQRLDGVSGSGISLAINQIASTIANPLTDPNGLAALFQIDVTLTGVAELFGSEWEMMFGNAICANDTIFVSGVGIQQQVPEPGALGLLLAGIFGLGATRGRRRSKA
jgi:hypothetical protein